MSRRTGHGHKSGANAITKKLEPLGYEVKQLDAFPLMGRAGVWAEYSYVELTIKHPLWYDLSYKLGYYFPALIHAYLYGKIHKNLLKKIQEYNPDLIITVHSMFTQVISKTLRKNNLNIPFYGAVIDLVDPPRLWFDKAMDYCFVPTEDVKADFLKRGYDEKKITVYGFPVRDDIKVRETPKTIKDKINILLVNPSVNLEKNIEFVTEVAKIENASVKMVCGKDEALLNKMNELQKDGKLPNNVQVFGFVTNMNELLDEAHILLTKAGPNMMIEAVNSKTIVVVTGHIKGQENRNHEYITKNNLGIQCENPKVIYKKLKELIETKKLDEYLNNLQKFNVPNGAEIVAEYVKNHIK
jgi:processive 1,2-diacylglycerol beta-glucosyltransferase